MSKPFLYYAPTRGGLYSGGFNVVGVTTEAHGQVYGRTLPDDKITHARATDVTYRFPDGTTPEFAIAARTRAEKERRRHQPMIEEARRNIRDLERERDLQVLDAAKGLYSPADVR